jgi:hypothetical protein
MQSTNSPTLTVSSITRSARRICYTALLLHSTLAVWMPEQFPPSPIERPILELLTGKKA